MGRLYISVLENQKIFDNKIMIQGCSIDTQATYESTENRFGFFFKSFGNCLPRV